MLTRAAADHNLELSGSYIISDRYRDVVMAHDIHGHGILVLTGYGRGEFEHYHSTWEHPPEFVAEDLTEAVDIVLRKSPSPYV
jgi:D-glycero-D-manno-heptose 1,7-bisphosphate phosphatase